MSSSVILLTNPAHNTALNARKRLVASGGLDPQVELHFIGLIISGVKDASKQGILWHHRRWLLNRLYPPSSSDAAEQQVFAEIPTHVLAHEINLVERATEVYPRNYYAWAHRGLCVRSAALGSDLSISVPIVDAEITTVQKWLELHVSDGTAAHHLWFCASLLPASGLSGSSEQRPDPGQIAHRIQSLHSHAQDLVMRYPEHEALWIYLRASISLLTQLEPIDASRVREAGLQQVNETASTIGDPATAAMMLWNLERFRNWYQRLDTPT
jgi:protein prenyltransferase alpha subunit repeat containing protein 1